MAIIKNYRAHFYSMGVMYGRILFIVVNDSHYTPT